MTITQQIATHITPSTGDTLIAYLLCAKKRIQMIRSCREDEAIGEDEESGSCDVARDTFLREYDHGDASAYRDTAGGAWEDVETPDDAWNEVMDCVLAVTSSATSTAWIVGYAAGIVDSMLLQFDTGAEGLPVGQKVTVHVNLHRQAQGLPHFAVSVGGKVVAYAGSGEVELRDAVPVVSEATWRRSLTSGKGGGPKRMVYAKVRGILQRRSASRGFSIPVRLNPNRGCFFHHANTGERWTGSRLVRFDGGGVTVVFGGPEDFAEPEQN